MKKIEENLKEDIRRTTIKFINDFNDMYSTEENKFGIHHIHRCIFELLSKNKRQAKKLCKEYLKTKNMKRDKCLCCCDDADENGCKYMKFILLESENMNILSIM